MMLEQYGLVPAPEMAPALAGASRGIPLRDRDGRVVAYTVVDAEDYEALAQRRWHRRDGYAARCIWRDRKVRSQRMHRRLLGLAHGDPREADHINGDPLDNRRANLRVVTHAQNGQNRRPSGNRGSSSRYRGVSWYAQTGRWLAAVRYQGKLYHLGYFTNEEDAASAAAAWREEHMPFTMN